MLDYLGYEYGEFEKATGNLIVNCIDPGDWAQMEHIIDTAMKENKEYCRSLSDAEKEWLLYLGQRHREKILGWEGGSYLYRGSAGYHWRDGDEAAPGAEKPAKAATDGGIQPYF